MRLKQNAIIEIESLVNRFNICDIFRDLHPDEQKYTFEKFRPQILRERIDFFLVSNSLRDFVTECDIYKNTVSDHDLISLYIKGHNVASRGPGIYKFNNELLTNTEFVNQMKDLIPDWINQAEAQLNDTREQWDFTKHKIGEFARKFGARVKKQRDQLKDELLKKIETISKNLNIQNVAEYEDALAQLKEITDIEIKGQILRSKCEDYEEGEKSSKYFLNLEKFRYKQKTIGKLKKPAFTLFFK